MYHNIDNSKHFENYFSRRFREVSIIIITNKGGIEMFTYTARNGKQKQVELLPKEVFQEKINFHYDWKRICRKYGLSNDKLNQIRESAEWDEAFHQWLSEQGYYRFSDTNERLDMRRKIIKLKKVN